MSFAQAKPQTTEPRFYRVTVFAPGRVAVRTQELFGVRNKAEALQAARQILLEYLEQGHQTGAVELRGQGTMIAISRDPGSIELEETDLINLLPGTSVL
ncbi:hypothetical protein O4H49_04610 [Kiloniella laminariae]|uniref:HicB-like antitoxin of toxin-antitoxin system domain-containing protein n=1 Tax=Kiloniella laminariae TaxID=454162 RepID=A0ABT4LJ81_9PROT|nr:hypothetical protein [Kiloniella laminariae]MCZ4280047.1 hypothetical protein [Kiloniella laminariae]